MEICAPDWLLGLVAMTIAGPAMLRAWRTGNGAVRPESARDDTSEG